MRVEYLVKYDPDNQQPYIKIPMGGRGLYKRLAIGEGLKVKSDTAGIDISIDEDWLRNYVERIVERECDDLYDRINQRGVYSPDY